MPVSRKSTKPVGITNASGQPEIVLEIDGLTISMAPPSRGIASSSTGGATTDAESAEEAAAEPPAESP